MDFFIIEKLIKYCKKGKKFLIKSWTKLWIVALSITVAILIQTWPNRYQDLFWRYDGMLEKYYRYDSIVNSRSPSSQATLFKEFKKIGVSKKLSVSKSLQALQDIFKCYQLYWMSLMLFLNDIKPVVSVILNHFQYHILYILVFEYYVVIAMLTVNLCTLTQCQR